ncbi:MAG: TolC family protein [Nevskiaceae bacterium]|nr:MAG: TolC family protein [Nevskiaceae bacterium]
MLSCIVRRLLVCVFLLVPVLTWAGDDSTISTFPLTLREAIARTLESNPDLSVFPLVRRSAEAERLQAGLRPNPELGATLENFAGSGNVRGTKSLETTLSLSQLIELGGKRDFRYGAADAVIGTVEADYVVARLDALAETARRYTDLAQAQAEIGIAERAVTLATSVGETVERRIRAGAASTAERNRAAVALTRARLDAQRAHAELAARRVALTAMWGGESADFTTVSAELEQLPALAQLAPLTGELRRSPSFARFAAERRLREAELKLARAQAVPDLTIGAGVRRLNSGAETSSRGADYGLVASLSLPLPLFNRNQGNIAAADARIAQSDAEREAAFLRLRSVLFGLYQEAVQARAQATALRDEAVPQAEQALTLTERGFVNGRFSFLELADAQRQVLDLRTQAITAFADAHRLDAEIERLTGQPVVAPIKPSPASGDSK